MVRKTDHENGYLPEDNLTVIGFAALPVLFAGARDMAVGSVDALPCPY